MLNVLSQGKDAGTAVQEDKTSHLSRSTKSERWLRERGGSSEPTRVTALHVLLARSKKEFYAARKDVCRQLVRYLLENRLEDTYETQSAEGKKKMLVLEVALYYENDEFIDCVEQCLRYKFPHFLDLQDDNRRNCLHHLFAWPLERFENTPLQQESP